MNEAEFLQRQIALEERHLERLLEDLTLALGARFAPPIIEPFCEAASEYLEFALSRRLQRVRKLAALLSTRATTDNGAMAARAQESRRIVSHLEQAAAAASSAAAAATSHVLRCRKLLDLYSSSLLSGDATLTASLAAQLEIEDWRALAAVDADSILKERSRYAAVAATAPPGVAVLDGGG